METPRIQAESGALHFPRPEGDLGLGFHYFPDDLHYRAMDLNAWLPELEALGASWLTLRTSPERAVPEFFLRGLLDAGVMPVLHMPLRPLAALDLTTLEGLAATYARWGLHYLVLYDRPNARCAWPRGGFERSALVDRFLDLWLPAATALRDNGLLPVFPPLEQGGTYWDTSFLAGALQSLGERGRSELLEQLVIGCYAFAGEHAPDWGRGGPAAWPESHPYLTPPGAQDQRGFRSFEWYNAVVTNKLGAPRPILMLAGGARLDQSTEAQDERFDEEWHKTCNMEIAEAVLQRRLPPYLINVSFWLLAADGKSDEALAAWYRPNGKPAKAMQGLKQLVGEQRARREAGANGRRSKPIRHYLLLPRYDGVPSSWHWQLVSEFVVNYQPTCGFSTEEALLARYVTLVGDETGIGPDVERELRQAGCEVERIAADEQKAVHARIVKVLSR